MSNPILHDIWITGKNHKSIKLNKQEFSKRVKLFEYVFGDNISGNIVQIGGGSLVGTWSMVLSKIADNLTVIDYSPAMIKIIKKTFKLNKMSYEDISIVCEKMEDYTNLEDADYVLFTYSMSFSNINKTIKNLTKNCKKGCKIIIAETMKPIILSLHTDLPKDNKKHNTKWENNLLKIEKEFSKNKKWKKTKRTIKGRGIPDLILHYTKL